MDPRLASYNWGQVFGEDGAQNAMKPEAIPGYVGSLAPFTRADVAEVCHFWESHPGDDTEWQGYAVVMLHDGRYASVEGGCDYTGWG